MDDLKQRQAKLKAQIAELGKRRREAESRATSERGRLEEVRARRLQLLEDLDSTDKATSAWAEDAVEKCERECASRDRHIEAAEVLLKKFAAELALLDAELSEVQQAINAAEKEAAFKEWIASFKEHLTSTDVALNASRSGLGELNMLAERGSREFGGKAVAFLEPLLEAFFVRHVNSELHGFRPAVPMYRPMSVMVHSQVRR